MDETGLSFGIVYEDYTAGNVADFGQAASALSAAQADMQYMESQYFSNPAYIYINDAPLLLVFGPRLFETEEEWTDIFSVLTQKPHFLTLWYESGDAGSNANGEFGWVNVNHFEELDNFYNERMDSLDTAAGSAYPGFRDFYKEGDWGNGLGWAIKHYRGLTFSLTLGRATATGIDFLQLVTWNDFGEGTMIEPTQLFDYIFLEELQEYTGTPFTQVDLMGVRELYRLRRRYADDLEIQEQLDQVYYYFVSLQTLEARQLLARIALQNN